MIVTELQYLEDCAKKLLPCPFCNSKKIFLHGFYFGDDSTHFQIDCEGCKVKVGYWYTTSDAIDKWNARSEKE